MPALSPVLLEPHARSRTPLRWSDDDLPAALLFIACAALACVLAPQSDTFFHLRAGEEIWRTGSVLRTEAFSHTSFGQPWHNHEWLSQVLFYLVYQAGGPLLLSLLAGGCAFAATFASWRMTAGPQEARIALLAAVLIVGAPEWAVRPQALSLPLVMLTMWLVLRERLAWLPALLALWANAHGVVLLGVVIAGVAALDALVWDRRRAPRAILVAAMSAAAPMATPLGWHYWPRVAQTVAEARDLGIHEYRSAFADSSSFPFWLLAVTFLALLAWRGPKVPWDRRLRVLVLTSLVFGIASVISIRNAPFFALIAAPAIAALLPVARAVRRRPAQWPAYALAGAAAVVAAVAVAGVWRDGNAARWRPLPADAIEAIRTCPAPMFNQYEDGGTLMWFVPEKKVFVDGRIEAYPREFLLRVQDADLRGEYRQLFREYGVRCAVNRTGSTLANALADDPSATIRFADARWTVFEIAGAR